MTVEARDVGACLGSVTAPSAVAEVWFAWVGDHANDVGRFSRDYLSPEEQERLHRYRSREAAERYVVTRSLVRIVLGDRLGMSPRDVLVSRTDTGKPIVTADVHFNVSHSGELVILALSADRSVGVDVERIREVERVTALVERWLMEDERLRVRDLVARGNTPSDAFLRVWSLKEARLKALGIGIAGATKTHVSDVEAFPLDHLLASLHGQRGEQSYVGALAFG